MCLAFCVSKTNDVYNANRPIYYSNSVIVSGGGKKKNRPKTKHQRWCGALGLVLTLRM